MHWVDATGDAIPHLRHIGERLLDLVFARTCPISGNAVENAPWRHLAPEGLAQLRHVTPPHCHTCGAPFYGQLAGTQKCPHCVGLCPVFQRGKTAVLAEDAGRHLVHTLKYHHGTWLAQDMARIMLSAQGMEGFLAGATLVPVPLHRRRHQWRGYNQAQLLAENLAKQLPSLRVTPLLERTRNTSTQTSLSRDERHQNMMDAFKLRHGATPDATTRYVLVDDVFTTGATLNACANALVSAGATTVDVVTFAHG
jgi:ComF family protein